MTQVQIRFVNFDRSEALEFYTEEHMKGLLKRIERRPGESKSVEVQFKQEAKAPLGSLKDCEVMISYRYPGIKKILHIKKHGADIKKVLIEAIRATESAIRRSTEKSESGRKTLGKSKLKVRELNRNFTTEGTSQESA